MSDLNSFDLYLASASPRRRDLLESMGLEISLCPENIDETPMDGETPQLYVKRLAIEKARAAQTALSVAGKLISDKPILGADTIVVCDGKLFGKPHSLEHALTMWKAMSGNTHQVMTAIAVIMNEQVQSVISENQVSFCQIEQTQMMSYWESGEPQDKAGAYAIQGLSSAWVELVKGSFTGVMGLPMYETNRLLKPHGLNWL